MADTQTQTGATPETGARTGATPPAQNGQQPDSESDKGATPETFEAWLSKQDESTQSLIEQRFTVLQNSLRSERDEKKSLDRQLKALSKSLDEGSEAKGQVDRLRSDLSEQAVRADFYEEAHKKGVSNLKLAYSAAKLDNLIDEKGRVDWTALKTQNPELFAVSQKPNYPPGNPGQGNREGPPKTQLSGNALMNQFIRETAGRR